MEQLELTNLSVGYRANEPLLQIESTTLNRGELVALIGKNGSGKSTLLKSIARFLPMLSGSISINNQDIHLLNSGEMATQIAVVLTEPINFGYGTVFELVATGRHPYLKGLGKLSEADKGIVHDALSDVGMQDYRSHVFNNLSDGQKQKVVLAKALAQKTPFILLDEPLAFLDFPSKMELSHLLHDLCKTQKIGVLMSTHDLDLAVNTSDTIWLINDKHIIADMPETLGIQNWFGKVFNSSSISYDNTIGKFVKNKTVSEAISVNIDDVVTKFWVEKALQRIGYAIETNAQLNVSMDNGVFVLQNEGNQTTYNSLQALIQYLKK